MHHDRALAVSAGVIGAVVIALLCAFTLPAGRATDTFGDHYEASLSEIKNESELPGIDSAFLFSGVGVFVMIISAIGWDPKPNRLSSRGARAKWERRQNDPVYRQRIRAWSVSAGALCTLSLPAYVQYKFSDFTSQARDSGTNVSISLGSGLILASCAIVVAAVIPWVAMYAGGSGQSTATPAQPQPQAPSLASQLADLNRLRQEGALTEAEFEAAKERLIHF